MRLPTIVRRELARESDAELGRGASMALSEQQAKPVIQQSYNLRPDLKGT